MKFIRADFGSDLTLRQMGDAEAGPVCQMEKHREPVEALAKSMAQTS